MAGAHDNDGNSPDDLPDLPEEWGVIVIPDDLSELSDDVEAIRAELRLAGPQTRRQRYAARPWRCRTIPTLHWAASSTRSGCGSSLTPRARP